MDKTAKTAPSENPATIDFIQSLLGSCHFNDRFFKFSSKRRFGYRLFIVPYPRV